MNMKKTIFTTLLALIVLFIVISILFSFIVNTQWATDKVIHMCQQIFPEFSYTHLQGKLNGNLDIDNLHIKTTAMTVNIDKLRLHTSVKHLPITSDKLFAEGVTIKLNKHIFDKHQNSKQQFFIPPIQFKNIQLKNLKLHILHAKKINLPEINGQVCLLINNYHIKLNNDTGNNYLEYRQNAKQHEIAAKLILNNSVFKLIGNGDRKSSQFSGSILDQHQGNLNFNGQITWDIKPRWQITAKATQLHLQDMYPNYWPGYLSFDATANNLPNSNSINITHVTGMIKEQKITASAKIASDDSGIQNISTQLDTDSAKVEVIGRLLPEYNLSWNIAISDLNKFIPNTSGVINSQGKLTGTSSFKQLDGKLVIQDLDYFNYQIKTLTSKFRVNSDTQHDGLIQLEAKQLKLKNLFFDELHIDSRGLITKHNLDISLQSKQQQITMNVDGSWQDQIWSGAIKQLQIKLPQQIYHLTNTTTLQFGTTHWLISDFCLDSPHSNFCLQASGNKLQKFSGSLSAQNFDLGIISSFLPQYYFLEGKANFKADIKQDYPRSFLGSLQANLSSGSLAHVTNDNSQKWSYHNAKLNLLWNEKGLNSNVSIYLVPQGQLLGELFFPKFNLQQYVQNQTMQGKLSWQTTNINFIESFVPYIKNPKGLLEANLKLSGAIKNPLIDIDAKLENGSFIIPNLQLKPTQVAIEAHGNQQLLNYRGSLTSGAGKLLVEGKTSLLDRPTQTNLSISGNNLLISNTAGIKIIANPYINLKIAKNEIDLDGALHIPSATLQPYDFGNNETLSDDVIYVKDKGQINERSSFKLHSHIKLTLGDKIFLNYRGIKGQILGELTILDNPNSATTANGQLNIQNGTYNLHNRTLQIDYGKLNFSGGPINNPFLDIRASRSLQNLNSNLLQNQLDQLRVGVSILGSLKQPKIELFSEPPGKNQADILSYLLLGVPTQDASGANAELLLQAADALNLGGTSKILNLKSQLQKSLGLSEMDIGTSSQIDPNTQKTTTHTSFVLGKYFSPKFYVNYSFDLFNYTNTLKVRYLLNKYWIVQSVTNTNGSGIDVLYVREKD